MRYALTLGELQPGDEFVIGRWALVNHREQSDLGPILSAPPRIVEMMDREKVTELRGNVIEHRCGSTFVTFQRFGIAQYELGPTYPCRRPAGGLISQGSQS
jgi:hypothetical protein